MKCQVAPDGLPNHFTGRMLQPADLGAGVRLENNRKMQPFPPLMQPPSTPDTDRVSLSTSHNPKPSSLQLDPGNIIKFIQSSWAALTRPQRVRRLRDLSRVTAGTMVCEDASSCPVRGSRPLLTLAALACRRSQDTTSPEQEGAQLIRMVCIS